MKKFSGFIIMLISFNIYAFTEVELTEQRIVDKSKSFSNQWGLDALDIPKYLNDNSAESLGLILPDQSTVNLNSNIYTHVNNASFNSHDSPGFYRFSTMQSAAQPLYISGVNFAYSKGRFSAETGVVSNSNNLLSSGKVYLQGAYRLFDTHRFNVSLTAKVEALDENNVQSYFGSEVLANNVSVFEERHATNTTLGIVSTYSINKRWKVLGMLSSTTLDNKIESSPLIKDNNLHMALIGTSYAF
jgi:hypothetical protein